MKIQHLILALIVSSALCGFATAENETAISIENIADNKISLYNQATDLAYEGNYNDSLVMLDRALEIDPEFTLAYVSKAGILLVKGDISGALEASETATSLNPNQADAWVCKSSALISLGRYEEGIDSAKKALEIDKNYFEAWINLATAYEKLGDYKEQLKASEEALKIDPENILALASKEKAEKMLAINPQESPMTPFLAVFGISAVLIAIFKRREN